LRKKIGSACAREEKREKAGVSDTATTILKPTSEEVKESEKERERE